MLYISRRIAVSVGNEEKEFSESDFLTLQGPLVILGEPGAGKSEFIKQLVATGAVASK